MVYTQQTPCQCFSFNYYLDEWLEAGLKPYVYGGKRTADTTYLLERVRNTRWGTHSKSIVFDEASVMVGTFNLIRGLHFTLRRFHYFVMTQLILPIMCVQT